MAVAPFRAECRNAKTCAKAEESQCRSRRELCQSPAISSVISFASRAVIVALERKELEDVAPYWGDAHHTVTPYYKL
jgi:hypothetical protein